MESLDEEVRGRESVSVIKQYYIIQQNMLLGLDHIAFLQKFPMNPHLKELNYNYATIVSTGKLIGCFYTRVLCSIFYVGLV